MTGSVTGGDYSGALGGLCGRNSGGSISNCYYLYSAGLDNGYGSPLTDSEMRQQNSFSGWDFSGNTSNGTSFTWILHEGEYSSLFYFDSTFVPHIFAGQGTVIDPYLIHDPNDLGAIHQQPYSHYLLQNNLDLAGISWSVAIIPDFRGVFDGGSHTVSNLNISGGSYLGLIAVSRSNASVIRLVLENVNITGGDYSRYLSGLCGWNEGDINDCYVSVSITSGINSTCLGGLCGRNDGRINNCNAIGSVTGDMDVCGDLGGLCGFNSGRISNCHATGSVTGGFTSNSLGGLCGRSYYGNISNCYATSVVTGEIISFSLGGLCGHIDNSSISNCYSTGSVTGGMFSSYIGGLCGYSDNSIVNHCYFLNTAGPDNGYGEPLYDSQMKVQSSFVGWDFVGDSNGTEDIWRMCVNGIHYPHLAWQYWQNGDFTCPDGVEMLDLMYFCNHWLAEGDNLRCDIAPTPGGDNIVNLLDHTKFSKHWLLE